jgi:hypothetical protein
MAYIEEASMPSGYGKTLFKRQETRNSSLIRNTENLQSLAAHTCNTSIQETEARGLLV